MSIHACRVDEGWLCSDSAEETDDFNKSEKAVRKAQLLNELGRKKYMYENAVKFSYIVSAK